jgi:hypothetical protein
MDLGDLTVRPVMPLRFVDKFNRNALPAAIWEARVGPGKLLVCTLDLDTDPAARPAARQLRRSIHAYLSSPDFNPSAGLSQETVAGLFREVRHTVSASGFHGGHRPEAAVDGDSASFWHTNWEGGGPQLPGWLAIDLGSPKVVNGLRYTPRQDMNRGRISSYRIEISPDGESWRTLLEGGFPDIRDVQEIRFKEPLRLRHLRLLGLADHGGAGSAAIAELEPMIPADADVRELGIIPGFNDAE